MIALAVLALTSIVSSINAYPISVARRDDASIAIPDDYAQGVLEPYEQYHTRYDQLNCESQHNTSFFDDCCHPLLATETLTADRKPYCTPSSGASSSAAPNNVAPAPSSSSSAAPKPSSTPASSGSQSSGPSFSGGIGTWFLQKGNAGACGQVHSDSDLIVAVPQAHWDNGNNCGKKVTITSGGHTEEATIADLCPTCDSDNCLDMSQGLFSAFAPFSQGTFPITWTLS